MHLDNVDDDTGVAILACPSLGVKTAIMQDRLDKARLLNKRHTELQTRQLAAMLEEELQCRAEGCRQETEESAKRERLQQREEALQKAKEARLTARNENEVNNLERARYLEWATAMEHLRQQQALDERRCAAGAIRATEKSQALAEKRRRQEATEQRLRTHEAKLESERRRKAAECDKKIARINLMEARRDEILAELAQLRRDGDGKYDALKALCHESAVANNDDLLRSLLETFVPRIASIPHTPRSCITDPTFFTKPRASSSGPVSTPRPAFSPHSSRQNSARRANSARRRVNSPARSLLGALSAATSQRCPETSKRTPANAFACKVSLDSRSTSAASLGGTGHISPSQSASCESMHAVSPSKTKIPSQNASCESMHAVDPSKTKIPLVFTDMRHQPMAGQSMAGNTVLVSEVKGQNLFTPPARLQKNIRAANVDLATITNIKARA